MIEYTCQTLSFIEDLFKYGRVSHLYKNCLTIKSVDHKSIVHSPVGNRVSCSYQNSSNIKVSHSYKNSSIMMAIIASLFNDIVCNPNHRLHSVLPQRKSCKYALRRKRDFTLPKCKTECLKNSFILSHVYNM